MIHRIKGHWAKSMFLVFFKPKEKKLWKELKEENSNLTGSALKNKGSAEDKSMLRTALYQPIWRDDRGRIFSDSFVLSNLLQYDLEWTIGKLGTRTYFDVGEKAENEIDIFNDGSLELVIEMLTVYGHRPFFNTNLEWGPSVSVGIAPSDDAAVLLLSYGLFLRPNGANWQFEFGGMTGISSAESLDSTQRDDSGIYVGVNLGALFDSKNQKMEKKK